MNFTERERKELNRLLKTRKKQGSDLVLCNFSTEIQVTHRLVKHYLKIKNDFILDFENLKYKVSIDNTTVDLSGCYLITISEV